MGRACLTGGVPSRVYLNGPGELDTVMLIGKKKPIKEFTRFLFVSCIVTLLWCDENLCDCCLTHIICIKRGILNIIVNT